jgi:hypothetical protein
MLESKTRRGGRAVEGTGLENRQRLTSLVGSNPTPSASESSVLGILSSMASSGSLRIPSISLSSPSQVLCLFGWKAPESLRAGSANSRF